MLLSLSPQFLARLYLEKGTLGMVRFPTFQTIESSLRTTDFTLGSWCKGLDRSDVRDR